MYSVLPTSASHVEGKQTIASLPPGGANLPRVLRVSVAHQRLQASLERRTVRSIHRRHDRFAHGMHRKNHRDPFSDQSN